MIRTYVQFAAATVVVIAIVLVSWSVSASLQSMLMTSLSSSPSPGSPTIGGGTLAAPAVAPAPALANDGAGGWTPVYNFTFGTGSSGGIAAPTVPNISTLVTYIGTAQNLAAGCVAQDQGNYWSKRSPAPQDTTNPCGWTPYSSGLSPPLFNFTSNTLQGLVEITDPSNIVADSLINAFMEVPRGGFSLANTAGHDVYLETVFRILPQPGKDLRYAYYGLWTPFYTGPVTCEVDFLEGFGFDNGGGSTAFNANYFHSQAATAFGGCDGSSGELVNLGGSNFESYVTFGVLMNANGNWSTYINMGSLTNHLLVTASGYPRATQPIVFWFDDEWGFRSMSNQIQPPGASGTNPVDASYFPVTYEHQYIRIYMR